MKTINLLFINCLAIIFFACSPEVSTLRLRPVAEHFYDDGYKQIVKQEEDSLKIVASFDGTYQKYMVFDVEIFNNSNQPVTISPKNFTAYPLNQQKEHLYQSNQNAVLAYQGLEPEEQLQLVSQEMARQDQRIKQARAVNTVLFVGGLVAILAGSTSNNRRYENNNTTAQLGNVMIEVAQVKRIIDHENYYSKMDKLDNQHYVFSRENFRSTTLMPHTSIRGGVFLESNPKAKFIQLDYHQFTTNISFLFEQNH